MLDIHNSWKPFIDKIKQNEKFQQTISLVEKDYLEKTIYPEKDSVFNVLKYPKNNIKVVIIGQDPYHGPKQAHGFSFSVPEGIKPPPSLVNIYKELNSEFGFTMNKQNGNLIKWVEQGVFLLNTSLTVEAHLPASHSKYGWDYITSQIIQELSESEKNIAFLLWGSHAASIEKHIKGEHLILKSAHPSPFSAHRGFLGNGHFLKTNEYLKSHNKPTIDWLI